MSHGRSRFFVRRELNLRLKHLGIPYHASVHWTKKSRKLHVPPSNCNPCWLSLGANTRFYNREVVKKGDKTT